jgi:hypothetical protein
MKQWIPAIWADVSWRCLFFGHRWHIGAMYAPRVCKRCRILHPSDLPGHRWRP